MKIVKHYRNVDGMYTVVVEDDNGNEFVIETTESSFSVGEARDVLAQRIRDQYARSTSEKATTAKSQLDAADFDAAKKAVEGAATVADLKAVLANQIELIGRVAEALGLEPKTPSVEAMP